ncbi:MAG: NAD(P)-dependent oxidoreductase [Opitutales bacterium]|nr:NAD(P)-dependent oxidoreductase [Opitutales bacterium]
MADRRIVVTGATGLIGRTLVRKLVEERHCVVAIGRGDRPAGLPEQVEYQAIDLSRLSPGSLRVLGSFDGIVHLAQGSGWHDFPRAAGTIASVTIAATAHLAEYAVAAGAKTFVFASSGGIYGPSARSIVETDPIRPAAELGFYLAAKASAEQLLSYFAQDLTVHILRPFFVYGQGQSRDFLIPRLLASVRSGKPVRVDGGRGPRLNPIHCDDAAAAIAVALSLQKPLVANIAGPDVATVREIAEMAALQLELAPTWEPTDRSPDDYVADISTMVAVLGVPRIRLFNGLAGLVDAGTAA